MIYGIYHLGTLSKPAACAVCGETMTTGEPFAQSWRHGITHRPENCPQVQRIKDAIDSQNLAETSPKGN